MLKVWVRERTSGGSFQKRRGEVGWDEMRWMGIEGRDVDVDDVDDGEDGGEDDDDDDGEGELCRREAR
jgi:hypothetical protein